jgi:putative ABC transport system permease protein
MFRRALRSASAGRGRLALPGLAISLSVSFLLATLVLSDTLVGRAAQDIAEAYSGTDAVVQGVVLGESDGGPGELGGAVRRSMPADMADRALAVEGVAGVAAQWTGFAKLVVDGASVGAGTAIDVGRNWIDDDTLNPFRLLTGREPRAIEEIVVDQRLANDAGVEIGDRVEVLTATGMHDATIVGTAGFAGSDAAPLQRTVLLSDAALSPWIDATGPASVLVDVDDGRVARDVASRLAEDLPDVEVTPGTEFIASMQEAATSPLQFLSLFLLVFAIVAALVGVTIIYNTFTLSVARRRREWGLLRAIGAEQRQVLGGVSAEAALLGVTATAVGIVAGLAGVGVLRRLVGLTGVTLLNGPPVVSARSLLIAAAVGVLTTLVSTVVPARRAAATAPVEALRDGAAEPRRVSRLRSAAGVGLSATAIVAAALAVWQGNTAWLAVAAMIVPGLVLCGPAIVVTASRALATPSRWFAGVNGSVAAGNLAASPRRAASTALAVMLGTALVTLFAIVSSSLSTAVGADVERGLRADLVITSATPDFATIDPTLADRISALPQVRTVSALAIAEGIVDGEPRAVGGIDPSTLPTLFDLDPVAGDVADLADGGLAAVGTDPALLGTQVEIEFEGSTLAATIDVVVTRSTGGFDAPSLFVDRSVLDASVDGLLDSLVFVSSGEADSGDATAAVRALVEDTPGSFLASRSEHIDSSAAEVASFRGFIDTMLALASTVALLGVANTTALAISERSGELGLLRAIGATRRDLRRTVRLEAALLSVVAASIGIVIAAGFGWALIDAGGGAEIPSVVIPWQRLGTTFLIAVAAGTAAAAWPAWRVARRPVLDLVGSDR